MLDCPRCSNPRFPGWVVSDGPITHCVMCGFIISDATQPDYNYSFEDRWKYKTRHLERVKH
jgi:hypothetical protein